MLPYPNWQRRLPQKQHVAGSNPAGSTTLMMQYNSYACKFPKEEFFDMIFMR